MVASRKFEIRLKPHEWERLRTTKALLQYGTMTAVVRHLLELGFKAKINEKAINAVELLREWVLEVRKMPRTDGGWDTQYGFVKVKK